MPNWTTIYEQHSAAVWKTAWRVLKVTHLAADCVQETFLSAMTLAEKQTIREWSGLLISLSTRRALDQLRRTCRARQRETFINQQEIVSTQKTPETLFADGELAERLRAALADLPAQQAEVFCLRTFSDMSYHDIAAQLNLEDTHVGVLLHRARNGLQRQLSDIRPLVPPGGNS
ncbi:MAG: sigma-70 family RNA polymerase sigma factor [Planctomycetota bacterium]